MATPTPGSGIPAWVTIPAFIAVAIGAAAFGLTQKGGSLSSPLRDPAAPIVCSGGDVFSLDGTEKNVPAPGVAVTARDRCHLIIHGGTYKGRIAVIAQDHAIVEIVGASLEGTTAAISAEGSAVVKTMRTTLRAPTGLEATDHAVVELVAGSATSTNAAISAAGQSRVEVKGAALQGKTVQKDTGRVIVSP